MVYIGLYKRFQCSICGNNKNGNMTKVIFSGLESSGKSLRLAMKADDILFRNAKWLKKSGVMRPIASNMKFSDGFELKARSLGVQVIYWKNLDELVLLENCDVFMDEIGNYFDARGWQDLSLDVRRWLTQAAKCGVEIYGSAQDFAQVDKSFRRLVNELYHIRKMIGSPRPSSTRPPVNRIWGFCMVRELDPNGYDEEAFKSKSIIPWGFFIRKKYCEVFDTNQKIVKSKPAPFRHIERDCAHCSFKKTIHL